MKRSVVVKKSFVTAPNNTRPPATTARRTLPLQRSVVLARATGGDGNQKQRGGDDEPDRDGERPGEGRSWGKGRMNVEDAFIFVLAPWDASVFAGVEEW